MGAGWQIPLLMSQKLMEPGMFGIFRPVLIWPERLSARLDDEHIEAILAHELRHAQRRDNLTAVLHMVVEAAFWFHPLVWWMERRMVEERERACDEAVVEMGSRPGIYAESLLKACRFCVESPLVCVSGITGADLSKRVLSIMTLRLERMSMGKKVTLALFGLIVIATPILFGQSEAAQKVMAVAMQSAPAPVRAAVHAMIAEEQTTSTALIAELQPTTEIQSDAKPFAFDVVSIRPVDPDPNLRKRRSGFQFTDDGFVSTNQSLLMTLLRQYRTELQLGPNGIVGGPDWVRTIQWDIRAKVADSDISEWSKLSNDSSAAAKERRNATLQAMLADRFKLKTHLETREGTIYALVVAKGGPKLKPSTPGGSTGFEMGQGHMNFKHATIGGVVALFAQELGNPVVDKSGLTGDYDFTLDWASDQKAATPGGQASATSEPSGPSIFTAVQEQLGLKLEAQKGPIETLVIDHAEKPSVDGAEVEAPSLMPVAQVQGAVTLVVRVSNATRPYGTANPTFTSTITGALNGDTFTINYSTPATITSPVGTYAINTTVTGTNIRNYNVTVIPGTLTITHATTASVAQGTGNTEQGTANGAAQGKPLKIDVVLIQSSRGCGHFGVIPGPEGVSVMCQSVKQMMEFAYGLSANTSDRLVSGGPGWADSANFDIQSKLDEESAVAFRKLPEEQQKVQREFMLRTILADHFQLKVHRETRDTPVYALVVAKSGFKLKEADPNQPDTHGMMNNGAPALPGSSSITVGWFGGHAVPISSLVNSLNLTGYSELDRIVVDRTGLTNKYDIKLTWAWTPRKAGDVAAIPGPLIFATVDEQLGLELDARTEPVETIIIDSIEQPSEN